MPVISLTLGLGLFFLGLRLVGDNLRGLCSGELRKRISTATRGPVMASWVGFIAGALMQSATAVTFICVSMVAAGLISFVAAAWVIVWSNAGLTLLAFIATLNIHPAVALLVGISGIVMGVLRLKGWQTAAGVFLGIGLILYGLHQMSEGCEPLKNEAWFRDGIHFAVSSPWWSFLAGILVAAILQSNTGATLMVITLATAGAIPFESAALMIYGTNLGAIVLRLLLAASLHGKSLQLVRLEDLFCVVSGIVMGLLYFIESLGVPLVFALSEAISKSESFRLAFLFFLSNILPAIAMIALMKPSLWLVARICPDKGKGSPGEPEFLVETALDDPPSAIDLLRKEIARLLRMVFSQDPNLSDHFSALCGSIETFGARLATHPNLDGSYGAELQQLREALSVIKHLQDSVQHFAARSEESQVQESADLRAFLSTHSEQAAKAIEAPGTIDIEELANSTKRGSPQVRNAIEPISRIPENMGAIALKEDFVLAVWTLHHLTKILRKSSATRPEMQNHTLA